MVRAIQARLDGLLVNERVAIPLAVESGSRAWGFPSPDSDYDCRFIFVRAIDDYLTPWPRRDVIETPLDAVLDVNGWELGKFLKLLLKGNAVAIEWLQSPIRYRIEPEFRSALLDFADTHGARVPIRRHYLHLGVAQWRRLDQIAEVNAKKLFYSLRPAAALRWLRVHPQASVAPMHFLTLLVESDPPAELIEMVTGLIAAKAATREMGTIAMPASVRRFVEEAFAQEAQELAAEPPTRLAPPAKAAGEALFRKLVRRFAPR